MRSGFRYPNGLWPNLFAITYTILGWVLGVWLLTRPAWMLNAAGVVLTAHALVYSAYLIHECAHHAIFAAPAANDRLGVALSWLNGACFTNYAKLKKQHLRHHADRVDAVAFDYRAALNKAPGWIRRGVLVLEWAYIPVVELIIRAQVISVSLIHGAARDRIRVIAIMLARAIFFAALAAVSVRALLLYGIAYLLFVSVLRFVDAFQHTYEVLLAPSHQPVPVDARRDRQYEHDNTYSNLISARRPWLNLLVLNFCYHNAHHARPAVPWHELPALHRSLYGGGDRQVMPCRDLLASYHRHRVTRVLAPDSGIVAAEGDRARAFIGGVGLSFLTIT